TLLSDVTKEMRVLREETFGPVAPVMAVPNLRAAIEEANDSEFGLGASLWTRNLGQADELAAQVESGMVFINGVVKSDPRMPFGGVKHSAVGRGSSGTGCPDSASPAAVAGCTRRDTRGRNSRVAVAEESRTPTRPHFRTH